MKTESAAALPRTEYTREEEQRKDGYYAYADGVPLVWRRQRQDHIGGH
jgi:hypothetical protein